MENSNPGGAALMLIGVLIPTLQAKGLLTVEELQVPLQELLKGQLGEQQREDVENALGLLEGMRMRLG